MTTIPTPPPANAIYQGQFGPFTIDPPDRREVVIYRSGLIVAALSFAVATASTLLAPTHPVTQPLISLCYGLFSAALGVSLWTIHIYLKPLHRALQLFWAVGSAAAVAVALADPEPLGLTVAHQPLTILGIGFSFAALTGIFFKEAFCFNRLETKVLTFLVPGLLLGHLVGVLPVQAEQVLGAIWSGLFVVFALRKSVQRIPDDIGDKSVFEHLKQQEQAG
jgi:uncharacterized integral membrane protein